MASNDEIEVRFQEAHGAYLFREGKPRAIRAGATSTVAASSSPIDASAGHGEGRIDRDSGST